MRYAPPARPFLDVLRHAECPELRVAVGLSSCATLPGPAQAAAPSRTVRQVLLPVDPPVPGDRLQPNGRWRDASLIPGFGSRDLPEVLAGVLLWRSRAAAAERGEEKFRGITTFRSGITVPAADLHALAAGTLDETKLAPLRGLPPDPGTGATLRAPAAGRRAPLRLDSRGHSRPGTAVQVAFAIAHAAAKDGWDLAAAQTWSLPASYAQKRR